MNRKDDFEKLQDYLNKIKEDVHYKNCGDIYDLFEIGNKKAPYDEIVIQIDAFVRKAHRNLVPKFKVIEKTILDFSTVAKSVLEHRRSEYDNFLKNNAPAIKELKNVFDVFTKYDTPPTLDSHEKLSLIKEALAQGIEKTRILALIDQWVTDGGVHCVDVKSRTPSVNDVKIEALLGKTHYEILGVGEDAENDEIKQKYLEVYKKNNESRDKKTANINLVLLNEAWECLRDSSKRRAYDLNLSQPKSTVPKGEPVFFVERKIHEAYRFKDITRGTTITEKNHHHQPWWRLADRENPFRLQLAGARSQQTAGKAQTGALCQYFYCEYPRQH